MWTLLTNQRARVSAVLLVGITIFCGACTSALAQFFEEEGLVLYNGDPADQAGLKIGSWGSGKYEENPRLAFSGRFSIKVSGRSLYDGVRLDFQNAPDITSYYNDRNGYIQLIARFRVQGEDTTYGYSSTYGTTSTATKPIRRVRVAMALNGEWVEGQVPLSACQVGEDGWMRISIPFAAMKAKKDLKEVRLKRLVITGDGNESFYIGAIRVITDNSEIQVFPNEDQYVAAGDDVMFRASCNPGAAAVKYSWDFDASDGIQEDAVGELVYHKYRKSGEYTVTLTISDLFGIKKSVSTQSKVTVYD